MQSNAARAIVAIVAVAVIVVGFVVFSGGDDSGDGTTDGTVATRTGADTSTKQPAGGGQKVPTIVVKDGQPEGGVTDLTFQKGETIDFAVDSDTAGEVHMHGYDVMKDVEAGDRVEFEVPADIEGIFEVELEQTATQIAQITVNP